MHRRIQQALQDTKRSLIVVPSSKFKIKVFEIHGGGTTHNSMTW